MRRDLLARRSTGVALAAALTIAFTPTTSLAATNIQLASTSSHGQKQHVDSRYVSISADGTKAAFASQANRFSPSDPDLIDDVYVKDLTTGQITLASILPDGVKSNAASFLPSLSGDGRSVAFISAATNLSPHDHDEGTDVYLKDMVTGRIRLISVSNEGRNVNQDCQSMALSSDGLTVAFETDGKLDPADTDALHDIYVWDGRTGELSLASTNSAGAKGDGHSQAPALSADGSLVAFTSQSTNLDPLDVDAQPDVFVKDVGTGSIALASITGNGVKGNDDSLGPTLSADGTRVAFTSYASNLDPRNRDGIAEIYLKDLVTGTLTLVSATRRGRIGDGESGWAAISADGGHVAFVTFAANLDPRDQDGVLDVYTWDEALGYARLASTSDDGVKGNHESNRPVLSSDGSKVAFESQSSNLDPADIDDRFDIYVKAV